MASIFVTRKIPDDGIILLREAGHEVTVSEKDGVLTKAELIAALQEKPYDAVLCLLTDTIDGEVMDAARTAKIFANYAVGYDNIDLAAAKERDVTITNTPGVLTDAVAEHTFALIMTLARRITEADRFTRAGKYDGWGPMLFLGTQLKGKTIGLIGTGRIGSRVAEIAMSFGMQVLCYDIAPSDTLQDMGAEFCGSVPEVLRAADIVSLHVPLLDSTKHLINEEAFKIMQPHALLINTSRGPVVDETALVDALKNNAIRGAALDVFEGEPALAPGLSELEQVVLTPHIASATIEARGAMSRMAAENIMAHLTGKTPPNAVTA